MASGYTPGLTVSSHTTIIKTRRLPLKGTVLVREGDRVRPDTVVARAEIPGLMQTVKVASLMGIEPTDVKSALLVKIGDTLEKGQLIAQTKGFMGFFKGECKSPVAGIVELVSDVSGNLGVREAASPVEITAYVPGTIKTVMAGEGVVVEAHGALVQGIFGIGGERRAPLKRVSASADAPLTESDITPDLAGKCIIGGSNISGAALRKAADLGVLGIVVGGIVDKDLVEYLGYDIGVAITGHENIPLTMILTEGFGTIAMAQRTFALLSSLEGVEASFSGATQIRAGVIRPEIIVANKETAPVLSGDENNFALAVGTPIRIIREPYFGKLATVTGLPSQLVRVASGTEVRVLEARLSEDNSSVMVPRANVEIVAG